MPAGGYYVTDKQKITYIDPRALSVPKVRITTVWDEDELTALKNDVKEQGIETPLLVAKDGEKLLVIDGKHRLDEALLNGFKTVPCIIREMDTKKMLLRNLASNRLRGKAPVSQEIQVVKELYSVHNATVEEITKETGFSRDRVESLVLISQAHPDILQALDDGKLKFGHATELIRLPDHASQSRMVSLCQQYNLNVQSLRATVTDTIAILKSQQEGQRSIITPTAPAIPTIACQLCGTDHMPHELKSIIVCHICYGSAMQSAETIKKALAESSKVDVKTSGVVKQ